MTDNLADVTPIECDALARIRRLAIPLLEGRGYVFKEAVCAKSQGSRPIVVAHADFQLEGRPLFVDFYFDFIGPTEKRPFNSYPSVWLLVASVIYPTDTQPEIFDLAEAVVDGAADDIREAVAKLADKLNDRFRHAISDR